MSESVPKRRVLPMRILYVCRANVCRSQSAAALMTDAAAGWGLRGVEIRSAGSVAEPGTPSCEVAPALQNRPPATSTALTPELIAWADLVLSADRDNQAAVAALDPAARSKAFTIRQSGRLSEWLLAYGMVDAARARAMYPQNWPARFEEGDPRAAVLPMPNTDADKVAWTVQELDAARGIAPIPMAGARPKPKRWWRKAKPEKPPMNIVDVEDPHQPPYSDVHRTGYLQMQEATTWLARMLAAVQGTPEQAAEGRRDQQAGE